jgi:hypothetical protein
MKAKATLLVAAALIPFLISVIDVPQLHLHISEGTGYVPFCVASGITWCALFVWTYVGTVAAKRGKLLWLLPFVLFAFSFPATFIYLWCTLMWAAANGRPP